MNPVKNETTGWSMRPFKITEYGKKNISKRKSKGETVSFFKECELIIERDGHSGDIVVKLEDNKGKILAELEAPYLPHSTFSLGPFHVYMQVEREKL